MSLLSLPNEAILLITDSLHCYRDNRALHHANRCFYSLLKQRLAQSNIEQCHKTLLRCAAAAGDYKLATKLLDDLVTARMKPNNTNADSNDDDIDSAFYYHPLYKMGYTQETILDIQSAFLAAIEANSKPLISLLLDRGAQAGFVFPRHVYNPDGSPEETKPPSPLDLAVKSGDNEVFDLLVEKGARRCTTDCPLVSAVEGRQFHMIKVLVEQVGCLHRGILLESLLRMQDRATFDYLLEIGFRVDLFGDGALFLVIAQGDIEMVRFLIKKGADPYAAPYSEPKLHSSVYTAILGGHTEICKMLVEEYSVHPDQGDLDLAQEMRNQEVIDLLSGFSYDDVPEKWPIFEKGYDIIDKETWGEPV